MTEPRAGRRDRAQLAVTVSLRFDPHEQPISCTAPEGHAPSVVVRGEHCAKDRSDEELLWEWVARELRGDHRTSELWLANGTSVEVRIEAVNDASEIVAALIRLDPSPCPDVIGARRRPRRGRDGPRFGWASLTDTEHHVAELVAEGLTNVQAAARLFLSHHTVEYHLRSIYRKLNIRSRVQLATLVTERALTPNSFIPAAEENGLR